MDFLTYKFQILVSAKSVGKAKEDDNLGRLGTACGSLAGLYTASSLAISFPYHDMDMPSQSVSRFFPELAVIGRPVVRLDKTNAIGTLAEPCGTSAFLGSTHSLCLGMGYDTEDAALS
jgi:hypothetical protein